MRSGRRQSRTRPSAAAKSATRFAGASLHGSLVCGRRNRGFKAGGRGLRRAPKTYNVRETVVTLAHLLRRWARHRSMLILLVSFAGLIASGAASAKPFPVIAFCTGGGQLCNQLATFKLTISGAGGVGQGAFIHSSPAACSSVRVHFLIDGTEVAVTGFVGPGGPPHSSASVLSVPESIQWACRRKERSEAAT